VDIFNQCEYCNHIRGLLYAIADRPQKEQWGAGFNIKTLHLEQLQCIEIYSSCNLGDGYSGTSGQFTAPVTLEMATVEHQDNLQLL